MSTPNPGDTPSSIESQNQATQLWITPIANPTIVVRGTTLTRQPIAQLQDPAGAGVRGGGTYTLISKNPPSTNVVVSKNPPDDLMNGNVVVTNLQTDAQIVTRFTPYAPYAHLAANYTLNLQIRLTGDAPSDEN